MTSEIRSSTLKNRVGLGTVSFTNTGIVVSGIVTANSFSGPYNGTDIVGTGITLTSTDTGSSAGPELKLFRNSASPADADYLGQLKFAGESDTGVERNYAKITGKILDASNGTEDGILEFAHIKGGAQTITGRWRSDSLQLLNSTNFSVAGTSEFTGAATFSDPLTLSKDANVVMDFSANSTSDARGIYFNSRAALTADYNDGYLRLNNQSQFANGVYTPLVMRADGGFRVDSHTVVNSSGFIVASRIAGALPAIDGSNLTGITQTTINSNAANRIITGSGSANTLEGNSNFTYTGSVVTHNNPSGLAKLDVKGSVGGGALGASISVRNTNSANNGSGEFQFQDPGSNIFAKIAGTNLTDGSNNGYMTFHTSSATSGLVERLRIRDDGIIETGTAIDDSAYDGNQRLRVGRTGDCSISIRSNGSTTSATGLDFGDDDDDRAGRIQYVHDGNYMSFHTNGAGTGSSNERLRIDSDGLLGLNVTPSYSGLFGGSQKGIHIGGTTAPFLRITSSTGSQGDLILQAGNSGGDVQMGNLNAGGDIVFWNKTSGGSLGESLRIASTGNVSIGTQNVGEGKLQVNGDITAKQQHGSSDMYGMLAGRKFDGTSAMGGYAIRYASGYESPWIVGYNAGSSYDNQITFGSMTTSDRSLATGVQKRMVIDMASGKVGINSTTPFQTLDVRGSINGGTVNQPFQRFHDSHGNQRTTKHYFRCTKGSTSIYDILTVDLNTNFHQALIILYYGTRLQAINDSVTYPVHKIIGVNRFNGGSINFDKQVIQQNANAQNHGDIDAVATSSTQYRIRLTFSGSTGGSSFAAGFVEIIGLGPGTDGAFYSLAHAHGITR